MTVQASEPVAGLRRLWAHARWADETMVAGLAGTAPPEPVLREFSHVLGTAEVWLARLERRASRLPVWPDLGPGQLAEAVRLVHAGYDAFLAALSPVRIAEPVSYVNSAGQEFDNPVGEILTHAALHGQYHRGKVNLLLRQAGREPFPVDYIAFVRGVPAATTKPR